MQKLSVYLYIFFIIAINIKFENIISYQSKLVLIIALLN